MGKKSYFSNLIFLVLLFQEVEKGYVPKFGVLIFNLALVMTSASKKILRIKKGT